MVVGKSRCERLGDWGLMRLVGEMCSFSLVGEVGEDTAGSFAVGASEGAAVVRAADQASSRGWLAIGNGMKTLKNSGGC